MAGNHDPRRPAGPSHAGVEAGVAMAMMAFGAIVVWGSLGVGIGWGAEGPKAGFFPFYIGLIIIGASVVNLVTLRRSGKPVGARFANWRALGQVMSVAVPTAIYVGLIPFAGIYVSSFLLIASFMLWFGRYGVSLVLLIALATPALAYAVFEIWFLLPLPKGPLEELIGL